MIGYNLQRKTTKLGINCSYAWSPANYILFRVSPVDFSHLSFGYSGTHQEGFSSSQGLRPVSVRPKACARFQFVPRLAPGFSSSQGLRPVPFILGNRTNGSNLQSITLPWR
jgi:hypothetical protein